MKLVPLLLMLAVTAPAQSLGDGTWVRAKSPHVTVYGDVPGEQAASIANRIERFHTLVTAALAPPADAFFAPVTVLVFDDERQLARLRPLYGGKPAEFSGLFLPSRERGLVLLDAAADARTTRVIFHEYTHRVVDLLGGPSPLWLHEGLAELYSTATAEAGTGEIGAPVEAHVELLRAEGLMPLERLFAVGPEDPEYNEARQQGSFYATAWVLAHYVVMNDAKAGRERLRDLARRLSSGEPPAAAVEAALGRPLAELEAEIGAWVRRETFPRRTVGLPPAATAPATVDAAPRDELQSFFGFALAFQQRYADAAPYFERARELNPESPLPYEGLGLVELLRGNTVPARELFGEAIRRGSRSPHANLAFAEASLESGEAARADEARKALERAVALNPSAPEPYMTLSNLARARKDYATALTWAERGIVAVPDDGGVRLSLGLAHLALRRYETAKAHLDRVAATEENEAFRRAAAFAAGSIERYLAAVGSAAGRVDVPLAVFEELYTNFHFAPAGVLGRVRRIDCAGRGVRVTVEAEGRRFVYTNPKGGDVQFHTLNYNGLELFDCDAAADREAIVEVVPSRTDPLGGTVKAVIFLNPVKLMPRRN
jgi:tetratricopeptide (TPR) repeat protein